MKYHYDVAIRISKKRPTENLKMVPPRLVSETRDRNDFGCNDPCYIANLTERREQYRKFALKDLAAGRDPRAWEDFIPRQIKIATPRAHPRLPSLR